MQLSQICEEFPPFEEIWHLWILSRPLNGAEQAFLDEVQDAYSKLKAARLKA